MENALCLMWCLLMSNLYVDCDSSSASGSGNDDNGVSNRRSGVVVEELYWFHV